MKAVLRPGVARSPRLALVLSGAFVIAASGCANQLALDAAAAGRLVDLRAELASDARKGRLPGEARALARSLAAGEIARAKGPDGLDRLRELEGCARPLEDALDHKAEGTDEVAALAMRMLLDAGLVAPADVRAKAGAPGDRGEATSVAAAWRAVGARALGRATDATRRRELLVDGALGVRVAALQAAGEAADPGDFDALFDVARRDPAPLARTLAVGALARIGGDHVVSALGDLWAHADEPLREALVLAWWGPRSREVGGRAKLVATIERQKGTPAITAAALVAVDPGASPSERGEAAGSLVRAIGAGPARDRVHALGAAPEVPGVREAVLLAAGDPDPIVAIAAIARRLEPSSVSGAPPGSAARRDLVAKLVAIAAAGPTADALRARAALARVGAPEVLPLLERALVSPDPRVREAAGVAFAKLGKPSRASFLLADADPRVRTTTACALLTGR